MVFSINQHRGMKMNFKFEFPEETLVIKKSDLKELMKELINEVEIEDKIMTVSEVADYLKVSVPTVRNMMLDRDIPYFQQGQVIRFKLSEVDRWLDINTINKRREDYGE
jgi:excisionase family DNA binding protein